MKLFQAICSAAILFASAALPAAADIAAFNAAVKKGDYAAAAAEAAATWPTLDKSREDIALIAREFGFIAFAARDYAAAKTFAKFAADHGDKSGAPDEFRVLSLVLLRVAEHKSSPSKAARDRLFDALTARATFAKYDNISFAATDALVAYDLEKGRWKDAQESTDLSAKLAAAGAPDFVRERRQYQLYGAVADYMATQKADVFDRFVTLEKEIAQDIKAAPNAQEAEKFQPLFWETSAWRESLDSHLTARGDKRPKPTEEEVRKRREELAGLIARLRESEPDSFKCISTVDQSEKPTYPVSALYQGFVGTVILRVDVDAEGNVSNPEIAAAVPDKYFGAAVMKNVKNMRFVPSKTWDPAECSLEKKGRMITIKFVIKR
jgi:TonB family protein